MLTNDWAVFRYNDFGINWYRVVLRIHQSLRLGKCWKLFWATFKSSTIHIDIMAWQRHSRKSIPITDDINFSGIIDLQSNICTCIMQRAIIVEDTFSTDLSSLFSRHLYLPFNSPNACSTTTLALLNDLLKSRWLWVRALVWGKWFHAPGHKFISWVSNNEWFYLGASYPSQNVAVFYCR